MPPHGPAAPQGHGQLTGPSAAPQEDPKKEKVLASKLSKKVTKVRGCEGVKKGVAMDAVRIRVWHRLGARNGGEGLLRYFFVSSVPEL